MITTSLVVNVIEEECVGCTRCVSVCPSNAMSMQDGHAVVAEDKCVGCQKCIEQCVPYNAIMPMPTSEPLTMGIDPDEYDWPAVRELCAKARFDPEQAVCQCTRTTAGEVAAAIVSGVHDTEALCLATGVRSSCGMWCLGPTLRLLEAHGVDVEREPGDRRTHPDGNEVAIWNIPADAADKYPEYRIRESQAAVESGYSLNTPAPMFPDIQPPWKPEGE
ncbi:4Fe-4S binding protein [Nocardia asteroides]|uniref:4Fe-4S binding protein n=1 Tax=Nocardia asteroides TaxID=1824 RepID=UPI0037CA7B0B